MKIQNILLSGLLGASFIATLPRSAVATSNAKSAPTPRKPSSEIPERREFPLSTTETPCDDFHKYVCSVAESNFRLRDDRQSHIFAFDDAAERLLEVKKRFVADLPKKSNLDPRTAQVRDTYLACMDGASSADSERREVQRILSGLAPLKTPLQVLQFSHRNVATDAGSFLAYGKAANIDDSNKLDIWMSGSLMLLPEQSYYKDKALMKDYEALVTHFFQLIYGKSMTAQQALQKAQAVIGLQKEFIKTYPLPEVERLRSNERRIMTQEAFLKAYPGLGLEMLLKDVPKETLVRLLIPETFDFFKKNLNAYPVDVWKDFYAFMNLKGIMDDAFPTYFKKAFALNKKYFGGPVKRSDRDERCTHLAEGEFVMELSAAMIDSVYPPFDETQMQAIGQKIRASLMTSIQNNTWLSRTATAAAVKKIQTMRLQMIRPRNDREWNMTPIRTYSSKDRIANGRTRRGAIWQKMLAELREPANKDAWGMGPLEGNAYYSAEENKFVVPLGLLQYPFYDKTGSLIENLGSTGTIMGHEIGHSIDDNGSNYDADGNLKAWMTPQDLTAFQKRTAGLIDLFNHAGHNGKLTLGENVGDLVGLTTSYEAAFPGGKGSIEDKQKFFIGFAHVFCGVSRPGDDEVALKTDPHALPRARINEQVKLQPGFSEAFSCKPGDKMFLDPEKRVRVW